MENRNRVVWTNDRALVTCMVIGILIKVFIVTYCIYPYASVTNEESNEDVRANGSNESTPNSTKLPRIKRTIIQPSCPSSYLVETIFPQLLRDLYIKKEMCRPEDINNPEKHKLPRPALRKNETANPRGTIVAYFVVGLLLTSLGAAFLEAFKAKGQSPAKSKTPLTRKCSLADLTVLRHTRKELVRGESLSEAPEAFKSSVHRSSPLHRRCSFPVAPGEPRYRRGSLQCAAGYGQSLWPRPDSRRVSVDVDHMQELRHPHTRLVRRR